MFKGIGFHKRLWAKHIVASQITLYTMHGLITSYRQNKSKMLILIKLEVFTKMN